MQIKILIMSVNGERLWPIDKPFPASLQIDTNLNVMNFKSVGENLAQAEFIFSVNYRPPVAQLRIKGLINVSGPKSELEKLIKQQDKSKPSPLILQSILNMVIVEAVILSRTLNIPPPIPLPSIVRKVESSKRRPPTYVT